LVAVAELLGINEAQALQHVAKYGPFLRFTSTIRSKPSGLLQLAST
jgi:hypothetical protein